MHMMCGMDDQEMLGSRDACRILDIDKSTLTRWAADGTLPPAMKLPGRNGAFLFKREDVEALALRRDQAASA